MYCMIQIYFVLNLQIRIKSLNPMKTLIYSIAADIVHWVILKFYAAMRVMAFIKGIGQEAEHLPGLR